MLLYKIIFQNQSFKFRIRDNVFKSFDFTYHLLNFGALILA